MNLITVVKYVEELTSLSPLRPLSRLLSLQYVYVCSQNMEVRRCKESSPVASAAVRGGSRGRPRPVLPFEGGASWQTATCRYNVLLSLLCFVRPHFSVFVAGLPSLLDTRQSFGAAQISLVSYLVRFFHALVAATFVVRTPRRRANSVCAIHP